MLIDTVEKQCASLRQFRGREDGAGYLTPAISAASRRQEASDDIAARAKRIGSDDVSEIGNFSQQKNDNKCQ